MKLKIGLYLCTVFFASATGFSANAQVCAMYQGQQICTSSTASLVRVTGMTSQQATAVTNAYNALQAAAKAKEAQAAAARQAQYEAAQRQAAANKAQQEKDKAAQLAAQARQRDQLALQQMAAQLEAQKRATAVLSKPNNAQLLAQEAARVQANNLAAQKAASQLAAQLLAAQPSLQARSNLQNQVSSQMGQSGATCNGYWQSGRCINNGLVAYNNGSPVNAMNQPQSTLSSGGKRQTCTLLYTYQAGKVVGNPKSVCTFS